MNYNVVSQQIDQAGAVTTEKTIIQCDTSDVVLD